MKIHIPTLEKFEGTLTCSAVGPLRMWHSNDELMGIQDNERRIFKYPPNAKRTWRKHLSMLRARNDECFTVRNFERETRKLLEKHGLTGSPVDPPQMTYYEWELETAQVVKSTRGKVSLEAIVDRMRAGLGYDPVKLDKQRATTADTNTQ